MRLKLALSGALVAITLLLSFGTTRADDSGWLVGHWEGHNTAKPSDTRHFVLDIATINADQSFVAQWGVDDRKVSGQGKIDNNAVTVNFPNGNSISLFRASDGSLAGSTENKDGSPGATLAFGKNGAPASIAAPPSGSGKGCQYLPVNSRGGAKLQAQDGEQVVLHLGVFRCVNGRLQRVN